METIIHNKKFINASIVLVCLLSVFTLGLIVHGFDRRGKYENGAQMPSIVVSGEGEVTAVPDIATLSFNISKEASTAADAQKLLNIQVSKTLEYLTTAKIADKDIKSEYGGLSPKYSYEQPQCFVYPCPQRDPKIVGYTATQSISLKVRVVDDANTVKTGLASVGITEISGPTFSIDNEDGYKDNAREKAIIDARAKAEVLAHQLHVRLGKIVSFSESGNAQYPMMYKVSSMMDSTAGSAPTLPKGENKISSNVSITYEIK
jgi:uncharacterized protein